MERSGRLKKGAAFGLRTCALVSASLLVISVMALMSAGPAFAVDVNLAWDANTEPDLSGYKVYYGTASRSYEYIVNAGNQTSCTLTGLTEGYVYYIAATAYDIYGNESGYSNEVVYDLSYNDPPDDPPEYGDPLFSDDFSDGDRNGDPDWEKVSGRWRTTKSGRYFSNPLRSNLTLVEDPLLDTFVSGRIESEIKLTPKCVKSSDAAIIFGYQDENHYRYVRLTKRRLVIGQVGDFGGELKGGKAVKRKKMKMKKWHHVRVDVDAFGQVDVYINNASEPALSYSFGMPVMGRVGLKAKKAKSYFDDFFVWDEAGMI